MARSAIALIAGVLLLTSTTKAWNDEGHMAVAAAAYDLLLDVPRQRVAELLRWNPSSQRWNTRVQFAPKDKRPKFRFMLAALWPDDIKSAPGYTNEDESDQRAGRNIGYTDRLQHRYWHYIDHPFSQDGTPLDDAKAGAVNAEERIGRFRTVLASDAGDRLKSYDLVWLEHLVGDVHQPLHSATRVSAQMRRGDVGGNSHCLDPAACKTNNLHSFWDSSVGTSEDLIEAESLAAALDPPDPARAKNPSTAAWTDESFAFARSQVYADPIQPGAGPSTITGLYRVHARQLSRQQIAVAAARLAAILNNELR